VSNFQHLEYIWIDGQFTDSGLDELANLRSLQNMSIGSPNITEEGIAALKEKLPALQFLQVLKSRGK